MIYIASPYTNKEADIMHARFLIVEAVTAFWMKQGLPVFSPIVHCHEIAKKFELPTNFDYWQKMNFAWIDAAEIMSVLQFPNWHLSKGCCGEIKYAENTGKNVTMFSWEEIKSIVLTPMRTDELEEAVHLLGNL